MKIILILIVFIFATIIIFLLHEHKKQEKRFKQKLLDFHEIILKISMKQNTQKQQIELATALQKSLKAKNNLLGNQIYDLNYSLFEVLSEHKLI